ncbi:MAG: redoxin domain-containing protein [Planctomycetota bacterium]
MMKSLTPMDLCHRSLAVLPLVLCCCLHSAVAAPPTAKTALSLKPVQPGVNYEQVDAADLESCEVVDLERKGWSGWEVLGPDGSVLRRFADTNKDKRIDLWSYFQYGIEVYRDIDEDGNGKADQYRWLATSGSRWGIDENEDGQIDRWKQISAEEVTAEVVAALREKDADRFTRLLISNDELKSLGLGSTKREQIAVKAKRAADDFADLAKRQTSIGANARWVQFAASAPGAMPAGVDGATRDLVIYENAVAMFEQGDRSGQLMVGTLIRVGDAWRMVDLPSVGNGDDTIAQSTGNFFTPGGTAIDAGMASSQIEPRTQEYVAELEEIDDLLAAAKTKKEFAGLHDRRADIVEGLIAAARSADERETWVRQLVDMLSVAAQTGEYPDGSRRLRSVARKFGGNDAGLKSYADFQAIATEYVIRQTPDADFAKVQEWYLDSLTGFVDLYPSTPEAAQAWLQLALSKEFEDKEREALTYYKRVSSAFPNTDAGEKAAGAVRRLESVGKQIDLRGETIEGKAFRLASLRGKPVVLHYWATWCEPCKQDMKLLRRLQASYQRAGLQLVGVNVDVTAQQANAFLRQNQLPWTQLYEPGGLESSGLAKQFGVQTLPTMMLIDKTGKVVRHNVRAAELEQELDQLLK